MMTKTEVNVQTALGLTKIFQIRIYYLTKKQCYTKIIRTGVAFHFDAGNALDSWWREFDMTAFNAAHPQWKNTHNRTVLAKVTDDETGIVRIYRHCGGTRNIALYWRSKISPWS